MNFQAWLQSEPGAMTQRNLRYRASDRFWWSAVNDGDDIEQRGLIYLWDKWHKDPDWFECYPSHYLGKVAFTRGRNDRYCHRIRRGNHIGDCAPLLESEDGDELNACPLSETHLPVQDQAVIGTDRRIDIERAIESTIHILSAAEASRPSNGHAAPVELIVRTICNAYMYHSGQSIRQGKGPSSDGAMQAYWSQHISERQWYRWKPRVLQTLAQCLEGYS